MAGGRAGNSRPVAHPDRVLHGLLFFAPQPPVPDDMPPFVHTPPTQLGMNAGQRPAQPPQCCGSVRKSTHTPEQAVSDDGQHTPAEQCSLAPHACPHMPQF